MSENKLKRLTEVENQDSTSEPPNKKRKNIIDDILIENFFCEYFYIDKSLLIKEFLEDGSKIICVTRPSGFGKTTNLKMLSYFFEMSYEHIKENEFQNLQNRTYFENLLISKEKKDDQTYLDKYQGKYPVIYLDFSSSFKIGITFEATIENFKILIKKLYRSYKNIHLKNLDSYDKEQWENFQSGNVSIYELIQSISFLCLSLNKALKKKIILLIDNYDSPILNTINTNNEFFKFYNEVFLSIFNQNEDNNYLFKTFITGNLKVEEYNFKKIKLTNYSIINSKYEEYFSITDSELKKLISIFKLNNEIFDKYYYYDINKLSSTHSTNVNNTNEINIIFSTYLTHFIDNNNNNNNNNNKSNNRNNIKADNMNNNDKVDKYIGNNNKDVKVKYYDLHSVLNYIKGIIKKKEFENDFSSEINTFFNEIFINFDYVMIKDIIFLLKNGYIEKKIPILINYEMLKKDYIEKHREIIWTLLVEYGYLIYDYMTVKKKLNFKIVKLKIRTNDIRELIENKFSVWKENLCEDEKITNTIDSLTSNYNEESIIEFLNDTIMNNFGYNYDYKYKFLDKYYFIIYSLLSLSDKYEIITKKNFNENDNIRELLVIPKDILENNILNNNKNDIVYIIFKNLSNNNIEEGCIEALDYNENLVFDGIELKKKYDKIIKFGIAFNEKICDVIYEIDYGNNIKKKEMKKEIYTGENYRDASVSNYYLIDKTKMISKLINKKYRVFLITRPRRFGKSLNLSMIEEFFEKPMNKKENEDRKLVFDGSEVSKDRKNMRHFHKYPVIYLNFKNIQANNFEEIENFLINEISTLFKNMRNKIEFEKLDELDKRDWNEIENKNKNNIKLLGSSLSFMCSCLRKFYKRRCIILIDEYDKVLMNSIKINVFDKVQLILESIFTSAFKGNDNLYFGVITGCYSFGLNRLNSGANNITRCTLHDDLYFSDCYGFTKEELETIFTDFNIFNKDEEGEEEVKSNKNQLKKKYDGYFIGNPSNNMYNPFSIINFIKNNQNKDKNSNNTFKNFWVDSSEDTTIKDIIERHKFSEEIDFLYLLNGRTIKVEIVPTLKLEQYYSNNVKKPILWSVLLHSGYLTLSGEEEYKKSLKNVDNQNVTSLTKKKSTSIENVNKAVEKLKKEKNAYETVEKLEEENMVYLKIPNEEILDKFYNTFISNMENQVNNNEYNIKNIEEFVNGLYEKNLQSINKNLSSYLLIFSPHHLYVNKISKNSTKSKEISPNKNVYQVLLMQMFLFNKVKDLCTEKDNGLGRIDFGFPNCKNRSTKEYILIEVKVYNEDNKDDDDLSKLCKKAINQIETKMYETDFKFRNYTSFIKYGIAFDKRKCLIEMKVNDEDIKEYEDNEGDNKTQGKINNNK